MGRGLASPTDAFARVMGRGRGLNANLAAERRPESVTNLPEEIEDVIRAFVRGGPSGRKGTSKGDSRVIWAVPRDEDSDDAFLSIAIQRNLLGARVGGKVLLSASTNTAWRDVIEGIRLVCADEDVPCEVALNPEMRVLMDEYRRSYSEAETDRLLAGGT